MTGQHPRRTPNAMSATSFVEEFGNHTRRYPGTSARRLRARSHSSTAGEERKRVHKNPTPEPTRIDLLHQSGPGANRAHRLTRDWPGTQTRTDDVEVMMQDVRRGTTDSELIAEAYRLESQPVLSRCDHIRLTLIHDELECRRRISGKDTP